MHPAVYLECALKLVFDRQVWQSVNGQLPLYCCTWSWTLWQGQSTFLWCNACFILRTLEHCALYSKTSS